MKRLMRWKNKWIVGVLSAFMVLHIFAGAVGAASDAGGSAGAERAVTAIASASSVIDAERLDEAIEQASGVLLAGGELSDWSAYALARAGVTVPVSYLADVEREVVERSGEFPRITDLERLAIGVQSAGGDPMNVGGYDLIAAIVNHDGMTRQGLNGPIYALIALGGGEYAIADDAQWNELKLIDWIVERQRTDNGWSLTSDADSDVDITSMVLTALAEYRAIEKVQSSVELGRAWLLAQLNEDGHFSGKFDTSESTAQTIVALVLLDGEGAEQDNAQAINGLTARLLDFQQRDGGFAHMIGQGTNGMATEQALAALAAYRAYLGNAVESSGNHGAIGDDEAVTAAGAAKVRVAVEGWQSPIAEGEIRAENALEAMEQLLQTSGVDYVVEELSFGKYIASIDGVDGGLFGGYDGWMYLVERNGEWVVPMVGIGEFEVEAGDRIIVYYGDSVTQITHSVTFDPVLPEPGKPFSVNVEKSEWNWDTSGFDVAPAVGAKVTIADQVVVTDDAGAAVFHEGLEAGTYRVEVSDYAEDAAPKLIRETANLFISSDAAKVSKWAVPYVQQVLNFGLMNGVSTDSSLQFAPQKSVTRAEFATILLRVLDETPLSNQQSPYTDVAAGKWYSGGIAKAKQLGFIAEGTTAFRPDAAMTREEMAVMMALAFQLTDGGAKADESAAYTSYSDLLLADSAAVPYISAVTTAGLMEGSGGKFAPKDTVTREMAATVALRAFELQRLR